MAKRTVKQRVDEFIAKKPKNATLSEAEMDEILKTDSTFDIIKYAFYLGYMRGMKANAKKDTDGHKKTVVSEKEKSINIISHIDDFWILNQFYRFLVNMTKDTEYEAFVPKKGGAR